MHCLCLHVSHAAHASRAGKSSATRLFMLSLEEALFVWPECFRVTSACGLLQDKMLTRVETARKEMQHIGDFDYGKLPPAIISKAFCEAYARCLPA